MHIHSSRLNMNAVGFYFVAQEEKAAAAQRAADVRRKLLKSGASVEGSASPEEAFMVGQWLDSRHSQVLSEDEYHAGAAGKDPDFG